eukprot:gene15070-19944_t
MHQPGVALLAVVYALATCTAGATADEGPCDILETSTLIHVLSAGGFADKAAHDAFCSPALDCVISNVMDQSPYGNHLGQRHKLVNASRHIACTFNFEWNVA